jgi:hypothetical protein
LLEEKIHDTLGKLARAERSGDAEAVQKACEELFALCREHHLDLPALLREAEAGPRPKVA